MTGVFLRRCLATTGLTAQEAIVDPRGLQNLVIYDPTADVIWRFPRRPPLTTQLDLAADRLRVARAHGVPTPEVLAVHPDPTPGIGHLVLSHVAGTALDEIDTDALPLAARDHLVASLIDVVETIGRIPPDQWPDPGPPWAPLWAQLHEWVREHAPESAGVTRAASQAARTSDIGVFHGDLGGVNCRVDPESGEVLAVLDWDTAMVGDRATDVAAIVAGVGPETAAALLEASPLWADRVERYRHYIDTWELQARRWAANSV